MNYRKKIKWISVILISIVILYAGKIYFTNEWIGMSGNVFKDQRESLQSSLNENSSKFKLVRIKLDTLCCKKITDDAALCTIDEIKKDRNWDKTKPSGKLTVNVIDYQGDIVKSIKFKGGDTISEYFMVDGEKLYNVSFDHEGFEGVYNYEMTSYNIF